MKKTKIIATIGPKSKDKNVLKQMILEGCDVIRINLAHASINFCDEVIKTIRIIEKEIKKPVGIMLDTNGPSVKLDNIDNGKIYLEEGKTIKLYNTKQQCNESSLSVNYPFVVNDLNIDDILLFNNGIVTLKVIDIDTDGVLCSIVKGGNVSSRETVHLQNGSFNLPFLNEDDIKYIKYGIKKNIDFLALSHVRDEQDVLSAIDLLIQNHNNHIEIISKIENPDAINNLDEIIKVSDGIMVARGDLSVELSLERLPYFQKNILLKTRENEKISIVATDLLSSMEQNSSPSRAEVSDVYNAVMDKCDAVLLSGETTKGDYPIEVINTMCKVIMSAEEDFDYLLNLEKTLRDTKQDITSSIAYSVVDSSLRLRSSCIIANTNSGYTAKRISHFRSYCPILGLSPNIDTVHNLTLLYGVIPVLTKECKNTDTIIKMCIKEAKDYLSLQESDIVVITGGFPISNKNTNFMKIEII